MPVDENEKHERIVESYKANVASLTEMKKLNQEILEKWALGISTAGLGFSINLVKQQDLNYTYLLLVPWLSFAIAIWSSLRSAYHGVKIADKGLDHLAKENENYCQTGKWATSDPSNSASMKRKMENLNRLTLWSLAVGALFLIIFASVNVLK